VSVATLVHPLNHFLTQNPSSEAGKLDHRAKMWERAAKTMLFAKFVITAAGLYLSMTGTSLYFFPIIIGLSLGAVLIHILERAFVHRFQNARQQANIERGVAAQIKQIRKKPVIIKAFYRKHPLGHPSPIDVSLLIARFNHYSRMCHDVEKKLHKKSKTLQLYSSDAEKLAPQYFFDCRQKIYQREQSALMAKLHSAVILQLLSNPYQEIDLTKIGRHKTYTFEPFTSDHEAFDTSQRINFFQFASKKPPLSATTIRNSKPTDLRKLLFDEVCHDANHLSGPMDRREQTAERT